MTLSLSNLKTHRSASKKRKRVGRGNASGHGTYSTRGLKGQKSRSGVSGLKRLGMRKLLLSIPKKRGFRSYQAKAQIVDLQAISAVFHDGAHINPKSLAAAGLIMSGNKVKILDRGEFKLKNVSFERVMVSKVAAEKIKAAGSIIK